MTNPLFDDAVEAAAKALWTTLALASGTDAVSYDEIVCRPRHIALRNELFNAAIETVSAFIRAAAGDEAKIAAIPRDEHPSPLDAVRRASQHFCYRFCMLAEAGSDPRLSLLPMRDALLAIDPKEQQSDR